MDTPVIRTLLNAARMCGRRAGFTIAAATIFALSVSATTATLSVAWALLWEQLPYDKSENLIIVSESWDGLDLPIVRLPTYRALKQQAGVLTGACTFRLESVTITDFDVPDRIGGVNVCAEFFDLLGARPILGRTFLPEEESVDRSKVVVISENFWRNRFDAQQSIIGRTIELDGEDYEVLGVIPNSFRFPLSRNQLMFDTIPTVAFWRPLGDRLQDYPPLQSQLRNFAGHMMIGRLADGTTIQQAIAQGSTILTRLRDQHPDAYETTRLEIRTLEEEFEGAYITPMSMFIGAIIALCMIATSNLSIMYIVQSVARRREFAIRSALGSGRGHLVQVISLELVIVSFLGTLVAIYFANLILGMISRLSPEAITQLGRIELNGYALVLSILLILIPCSLVVLLAYVRHLRASNVYGGSSESRHQLISRPPSRRLLLSFLAIQVSLTVMLLLDAGVLARGFIQASTSDLGFSGRDSLTLRVGVSLRQYVNDWQGVSQNLNAMVRDINALPGVLHTGAIDNIPLSGPSNIGTTTPYGGDKESEILAAYRWIVGDYFSSIGIPLMYGRFFSTEDAVSAAGEAIVSQGVVDRLWPDVDPIGQQLKRAEAEEDGPWYTVVGVVADIYNSPYDVEIHPQVYLADSYPWMTIVVAPDTGVSASQIADSVTRAVHRIDPAMAVSDVQTVEDVVTGSFALQRFSLVLGFTLAAIAAMLVLGGIVAVTTYLVAQERFSIAIRVAMGASETQIRKSYTVQIAVVSIVGLLVGVLLHSLTTDILRGLLFGVDHWDAPTIMVVGLGVVLVNLLVCGVVFRLSTRSISIVDALSPR